MKKEVVLLLCGIVALAILFFFMPNEVGLVENADCFEGKNFSFQISQYPSGGLRNGLHLNTTTYDAFGVMMKHKDEALYFVREGEGHTSRGRIVLWSYDLEKKNWTGKRLVYCNPDYDSRNLGGGVVNGKIYLFFGRLDRTNGSAFADSGYIFSDNWGKSWSEYKKIDVNSKISTYYPYGDVIKAGKAYYQAYYGWDRNECYGCEDVTYYIKAFKSEDKGKTWKDGPVIYSGREALTESALAYLGDGKVIALIRNNDLPGGHLKQAISQDYGESWEEIGDTSLGDETGIKIPTLYYSRDSNELIALYLDRGDEARRTKLKASFLHPENALNPKNWSDPKVIDLYPGECCGYASIIEAEEGYFIVHSKEINQGDADIFSGFLD